MKASGKEPARTLTTADLCHSCPARAVVETVMVQGRPQRKGLRSCPQCQRPADAVGNLNIRADDRRKRIAHWGWDGPLGPCDGVGCTSSSMPSTLFQRDPGVHPACPFVSRRW
jgi:hypothetical protein